MDRELSSIFEMHKSQKHNEEMLHQESLARQSHADKWDDAWNAAINQCVISTDPFDPELFAKLLLDLADVLREQFEDFVLLSLKWDAIHQYSVPSRLAFKFTRMACQGSPLSEISEASKRAHSENLMPSIRVELGEIRHSLRGLHQSGSGMPFSPELTQRELNILLDVTYDKIRQEIRSEKWEHWRHQDRPTAQKRQWRAKDNETQKRLLIAYREKYWKITEK